VKNIIDELDLALKEYLQSHVEFSLNGKTIKSGKLYLYEHGYFNYVFHIKTKSKKTSIKVPFPFDYVFKNEELSLDYTINSFTSGISLLEKVVKSMKIENPSKFYNNKLIIRKR